MANKQQITSDQEDMDASWSCGQTSDMPTLGAPVSCGQAVPLTPTLILNPTQPAAAAEGHRFRPSTSLYVGLEWPVADTVKGACDAERVLREDAERVTKMRVKSTTVFILRDYAFVEFCTVDDAMRASRILRNPAVRLLASRIHVTFADPTRRKTKGAMRGAAARRCGDSSVQTSGSESGSTPVHVDSLLVVPPPRPEQDRRASRSRSRSRESKDRSQSRSGSRSRSRSPRRGRADRRSPEPRPQEPEQDAGCGERAVVSKNAVWRGVIYKGDEELCHVVMSTDAPDKIDQCKSRLDGKQSIRISTRASIDDILRFVGTRDMAPDVCVLDMRCDELQAKWRSRYTQLHDWLVERNTAGVIKLADDSGVDDTLISIYVMTTAAARSAGLIRGCNITSLVCGVVV